MAVSKPYRYGLGAFAWCFFAGLGLPKGVWWVLVGFAAWLKSATWQFRNRIDMALVPLLGAFFAGLGVPKRVWWVLVGFDAWPKGVWWVLLLGLKVPRGSFETA